ncbi:tetratricopeptide repeat protein [Selenomonas sp. FC4001]|uniref:tetratricopeptide repeat protein n=1 Tax=Selenomonas sp. FC4001 TaxID=1408313 RepID=UPI00068BAB7C|nr:sel1 repeat family protein [Selenomonas sp. FC4001]
MKNKDTISNDDLLYPTKDKPSEDTSVLYQSIHENSFRSLKATKYNARQGQGFAAEDGNNLIDRFRFRDAKVIGNDNKKNGPDRISDGQLIQTKYCRTAADSVSAAFRHGEYRYIDSNGMPMQLEVPKDQYEEALKYMRQRIAKGEVPGITDPDQADKIIRQGNIDYQTACRIAKAGNIDSLLYDAANGSIIASGVFGISGIISFAQCLWSGKKINEAIDIAIYNGIKSGGYAFICSIATAQLTRTSLNNALLKPSIKIVKLLPRKARKILAQSLKNGSITCSEEVTRDLAKLLRGNLIAAGVTMIALSAEDITNAFRGRISAKQLFKNITTLFAGLSGGYTGAAAGGAIGAPLGPAGITAGSIVGGIIGATAIGQGTNILISKIVEDDVDFMLRIFNDELIKLNDEYLLTKEETDIIIDELHLALTPETMFKMYESNNRNEYARNILIEIIEQLISWRSKIKINPEIIATTTKDIDFNNHQSASPINPLSNTNKHHISLGEKKAIYIKRQKQINLMQFQSLKLLLKINDIPTRREITMNKDFIEHEIDGLITKGEIYFEDITTLMSESIKLNVEKKETNYELKPNGILNRIWGGITGSNHKKQVKINEIDSRAQELSLLIMNKIVEKHMLDTCIIGMARTLILDSNNKLSDRLSALEEKVTFLDRRTTMLEIDRDLDNIEKDIIFNKEEYKKMSDITKFMTLTMRIYKKVGRLYKEEHIDLLKRVMNSIGLPPENKINLYRIIRDLFNSQKLLDELIGNSDILTNASVTNSGIIMALRKMYAIEHEEAYILDGIYQEIKDTLSSNSIDNIKDNIIINYLSKKGCFIDTDVDNLNFFHNLLYAIKTIHSISDYEKYEKLHIAEELYLSNKFEEAIPILEELAAIGVTRAMYFLGEIYSWLLCTGKKNITRANYWRKKGTELNDILCYATSIYDSSTNNAVYVINNTYSKLNDLAKSGDYYAQLELGCLYYNAQNYITALNYLHAAEKNNSSIAQLYIGLSYEKLGHIDKAIEYYKKSAIAGLYQGRFYLERVNQQS